MKVVEPSPPPIPSGRTSRFPLSGWLGLPHPRAERGLTAADRADALRVVNDALGSFLLRAGEVIDQVRMSAYDPQS
ncbi:hypothetical protein IVB40_22090 [Bradyrhizobium sp. 40]|uniref:hypothetical protein n=1 Tax=Bradyrhizobium sp. 40 TaxID=2782674 RepID=UPI001FFF2F60|nr:hypothetical protein [Bradyrhizobium sp. 40]UPJ40018.1 hypothetical protein IVB40_22090 [Bradyrhizobium sp. 40]